MVWRIRGGELPLSWTLVDPELHYGQISTTQKDGTPPFPRRNAHSRTLYSKRSLLLDTQSSCVVLLVVLGLVRCLRWKMGTKLGRSQLHVRPVRGFSRARTVGTSLLSRLEAAENTSPAKSRRSSVVSWSESPRDQAVPKSVEAVMEDCTESHQTWNEMLGEQSRSHVGTALPTAMGPCAPSEPVPHSSGFVVTVSTPLSLVGLQAYFPLCKAHRALFVSTLALIVRYLMDSANLVEKAQYKRLLHTSPYISTPSKPVLPSSGNEVTREHAVISGFSAES